MKKLIPVCLMLIAFAVLAITPTTPPTGDVTLEWSVTGSLVASNRFVVIGSPDMTIPLTSWQVLTNLPGLTTNVTVRITPGAFFFAVVETNLWGVSPPSNVASTPPLPRAPQVGIRQAN